MDKCNVFLWAEVKDQKSLEEFKELIEKIKIVGNLHGIVRIIDRIKLDIKSL